MENLIDFKQHGHRTVPVHYGNKNIHLMFLENTNFRIAWRKITILFCSKDACQSYYGVFQVN